MIYSIICVSSRWVHGFPAQCRQPEVFFASAILSNSLLIGVQVHYAAQSIGSPLPPAFFIVEQMLVSQVLFYSSCIGAVVLKYSMGHDGHGSSMVFWIPMLIFSFCHVGLPAISFLPAKPHLPPRVYALLFLVELILRVLAEGWPFFWSSPNMVWNYLESRRRFWSSYSCN